MAARTPTTPKQSKSSGTARPEQDESVAGTFGRAIGEVVTSPASTEDPALDGALNPGIDSKPAPPAKPGEPQVRGG